MPKPIASQRIAKQSIAGRPIATRFGLENRQEPQHFPAGTYTFKAPVAGDWKFVGWGPGGGSNAGAAGGASGAYVEVTRHLAAGQKVDIVVRDSSVTTATTITFPDGTVASAGGASGATAGVASIVNRKPGDVMLDGTAGKPTGTAANGDAGQGTGGGAGGTGGTFPSTDSGGAGAPANLPYRGGNGGSLGSLGSGHGRTPGGGSAAQGTPNALPGGDGQVIASLVRE
jgi:hypothetical protein